MLHQYSMLGAQPSPLQPAKSPSPEAQFFGGQSRHFARFGPDFQRGIVTYEIAGFGDRTCIIGAIRFPCFAYVIVSHKQVETVERHGPNA